MVKKVTCFFLVLFLAGAIQAQRAKIVVQSVSPGDLTTTEFKTINSAATGLNIIPIGTYAYFSPQNIADTNSVKSATFTLVSAPNGSAAAIGSFGSRMWDTLKLDVKGQYQVKLSITTATGTADTTISVYGATYVGVSTFDGVNNTAALTCTTCHSSMATFSPIFSSWPTSAHATSFKNKMTDPTNSHFGPSCYKCHTTGSDKNIVAKNNGFDDVAATLGYTWTGPANAGKWDTLKTQFPGLVPFATIGCESCHGPASEHASTGDKTKIQISAADGACFACHDNAPRYPQPHQYKNSVHSNAVWSSSFAQTASSQNNNLQNCIRCHDANGFINYSKGRTTNTTGLVQADHQVITCATCHDPHGSSNAFMLRSVPAGTDTLANKFSTTGLGGTGQICFNCHKARAEANATLATTLSTRWGPHHGTQTDVFFAQNAINFDATAYPTGTHRYAVTNACVDCHMQATPDTSDHANHDVVGGHSWAMSNPASGFDNVAVCANCHGPISSFDDIKASADYDGNGKIESVQTEVRGLIKLLKLALPHTGTDTPVVSTTLIAKSKDSVVMKKAYWNMQMIENDGSYGVHNSKYSIAVLQKSIKAVSPTAIKDAKLLNLSYKLEQNYPNPFNPTTKISFTVPQAGNVKIRVFDIMGNLVKEIYNQNVNAGQYSATWSGDDLSGNKVASGIYFYKLETPNFTVSKKMILMK